MASFIFTLLAIAAALAAGVAAGYMYRKNVQEKKIGRTEEYARNLLDDAQRRKASSKRRKRSSASRTSWIARFATAAPRCSAASAA